MTTASAEFDKNDIKNYTPKDKDYFRIYMKERYRTNTCRRVDCDVCGKSVIYASISRHKNGDKCKKSAEAYKLSVIERIKKLEEFMNKFNMVVDNDTFVNKLD